MTISRSSADSVPKLSRYAPVLRNRSRIAGLCATVRNKFSGGIPGGIIRSSVREISGSYGGSRGARRGAVAGIDVLSLRNQKREHIASETQAQALLDVLGPRRPGSGAGGVRDERQDSGLEIEQ